MLKRSTTTKVKKELTLTLFKIWNFSQEAYRFDYFYLVRHAFIPWQLFKWKKILIHFDISTIGLILCDFTGDMNIPRHRSNLCPHVYSLVDLSIVCESWRFWNNALKIKMHNMFLWQKNYMMINSVLWLNLIWSCKSY